MIGGRQRARELTDAECRVAKLAAAGLSTKEIAAILFLAERTVDGHLGSVYRKLGIHNRTELCSSSRTTTRARRIDPIPSFGPIPDDRRPHP